MPPRARPHRAAEFFQLRDLWAGGAVEKRRFGRAARTVDIEYRSRDRGASLNIVSKECKDLGLD